MGVLLLSFLWLRVGPSLLLLLLLTLLLLVLLLIALLLVAFRLVEILGKRLRFASFCRSGTYDGPSTPLWGRVLPGR